MEPGLLRPCVLTKGSLDFISSVMDRKPLEGVKQGINTTQFVF